jgi:hypothetical protein
MGPFTPFQRRLTVFMARHHHPQYQDVASAVPQSWIDEYDAWCASAESKALLRAIKEFRGAEGRKKAPAVIAPRRLTASSS